MTLSFTAQDLATPERSDAPDSWDARYVRSYLLLRVFIGAFAIALPWVVIFVSKLVFEETQFPRGTVSGYYYSGSRELFTAMMSATGVFLIAYKISP